MAPHDGLRLPNAKWVVSIDFGTRGSGFAIRRALAPPGAAPTLHEAWPDQPDSRYPKDRTAILYRSREAIAFGWRARKMWLSLDGSARATHAYVESFKLALQDPARAATLPSWLSPEQAVGDFLCLMREYAMDLFEDKYSTDPAPPTEDNIHWCLTVPAMWSEASKQAMRKAAVRAGLITTLTSPRLTIILEPEAAALHALVHKAPPLFAGMTVMVVDAGGGTTDVTVHACRSVGGQAVLAEAVSAEGAMCGGVMVDEAFRAYYRSTVGPSQFDEWSRCQPQELAQVMDKWEVVKCAFGASSSGPQLRSARAASSFKVPIPPHLLKILAVSTRQRLRGVQSGLDSDLVLQPSVMMSFFDRPVQGIVDLAVKQQEATRSAGRPLSMVLLVGGFARSPYLQERVTTAITAACAGHSPSVTVITPPSPHAAVLNGAVVYGSSPHLIHARISKYSYGLCISEPYSSDAPDMVWIADRNMYYTLKAFKTFVSKGEQVGHGQAVVHGFSPLYNNQSTVTFPLFVSDHKSIKYVLDSDMETRLAATVTINLPSPLPPGCRTAADLRLKAEMRFGGTELTLACWESTTKAPVSASIKFASA